MIRKLTIILAFCVLGNCLFAADYDLYDELLTQYTSETEIKNVKVTGVDYKGLIKDERYKKLLNDFEFTYPKLILDDTERLAFWLNVYNLFSIKVITDNYPLTSIKKAGNLYHPIEKQKIIKVGGAVYSLSDIKILIRKEFDEPLIHAALCDTAVSGPDLRRAAYRAEELKQRLNEQLGAFLANPDKGLYLDMENKVLYMSPIFTRDAEDFKKWGGLINFVEKYLTAEEHEFLDNNRYKIKYFDYNWELNEWVR